MSLEETVSFFETYREAFNRLDGDAVADLWCQASGIADSGGPEGSARLTWWPQDAPMRGNHRALCAAYRNAGYGRADFTLQQHVSMGVNHACAQVHWTITRSDGSLLQQFHTGYQLMRTPAGPRVLLAVTHQENLAEMERHAAQ